MYIVAPRFKNASNFEVIELKQGKIQIKLVNNQFDLKLILTYNMYCIVYKIMIITVKAVFSPLLNKSPILKSD